MGILRAVGRVLRTPKVVVQLCDHTAAGSAEDMIRPLVREIVAAGPLEIRRVTTERYFEGVITRDQLDRCVATLDAHLGLPAKPFRHRASFENGLAQLVDSRGGIDTDQCLYLRRYEADGGVAFAALWPWSDGESITLKVGIYD